MPLQLTVTEGILPKGQEGVAFARLSEGFLDGDCIECPVHQALFNVKTGEAVAPPAYQPVKTFPCRIEGDDILIDK